MVFTGDTLFLGGCGRIFEGTAAQMHHSINTRLAELPAQTQIYCGHEYTLNNLKFAAHMEPENTAIEREILRAQRLRNKGLPTVPGRIQWEKESNPFMRIHSPEILKKVLNVQLEATSEEAFGIVRELKNAF